MLVYRDNDGFLCYVISDINVSHNFSADAKSDIAVKVVNSLVDVKANIVTSG
jgi:hypothetical protein